MEQSIVSPTAQPQTHPLPQLHLATPGLQAGAMNLLLSLSSLVAGADQGSVLGLGGLGQLGSRAAPASASEGMGLVDGRAAGLLEGWKGVQGWSCPIPSF